MGDFAKFRQNEKRKSNFLFASSFILAFIAIEFSQYLFAALQIGSFNVHFGHNSNDRQMQQDFLGTVYNRVIVAPIWEEIVFRVPVFIVAVLATTMRTRLLASVVSSAVFGFAHVLTALALRPNDLWGSIVYVWGYILWAGIVGFILCLFVIVNRKNAWRAIPGSMALHFLNNFIATFL